MEKSLSSRLTHVLSRIVPSLVVVSSCSLLFVSPQLGYAAPAPSTHAVTPSKPPAIAYATKKIGAFSFPLLTRLPNKRVLRQVNAQLTKLAKSLACGSDETLTDLRQQALTDAVGQNQTPPLTRQRLARMNRQQIIHALNWDSSVEATTTYATPDLLSVQVNYDSYCGGAHPDSGDVSVTYDLRTGTSIPLTGLFTNFEKDKSTLTDRLIAKYKEITSAADNGDECLTALTNDVAFEDNSYYLGADHRVHVVTSGFPHALQACSEDLSLTKDDLNGLYAKGSVLDRFFTAH